MKNIVGIISPLRNWAPNAAPNSRSLWLRKTSSTSRWRPNTLTSWWPVKASSMWPLSSPVLFHISLKRPWLRLPMAIAAASDSGTATIAMRASSGETQNIMARTPTSVSRFESSCDRVCCSDVETLSMSLVTRDSSSPRGWRSKKRSGSRLILADTSSRIR